MKYRFLIDIENGNEIEVDMVNNKSKKWYKITEKTLTALGYDNIKISRDSFGRRVHHNLTQIYKEELAGKGFCVIDAKCSQPRLLYLMMKERGIVDERYNSIFDNPDLISSIDISFLHTPTVIYLPSFEFIIIMSSNFTNPPDFVFVVGYQQ